MSQRLKAGLNWPALPVPAGEPDAVGPEVSILASVAKFVCNTRPVFLFTHFSPRLSKSSLVSLADPWAEGVGQEASWA